MAAVHPPSRQCTGRPESHLAGRPWCSPRPRVSAERVGRQPSATAEVWPCCTFLSQYQPLAKEPHPERGLLRPAPRTRRTNLGVQGRVTTPVPREQPSQVGHARSCQALLGATQPRQLQHSRCTHSASNTGRTEARQRYPSPQGNNSGESRRHGRGWRRITHQRTAGAPVQAA